tara:strand:+ start:2293 stop:2616 length:324 start_codon:yes stop_codon:yes gene_type:complete
LKYSLNNKEFSKLFSSHKSLFIGDLLFRYKKNNSSKLGLTVSKKYGNAIKRNLFKRRARVLFIKYFSNHNLHLIVQPNKKTVSWLCLNQYFIKLKNQIYDKTAYSIN